MRRLATVGGPVIAAAALAAVVMAVLVPRPAIVDASYKIAHAAPLPLIRAFNAQGHLLKKVNAPII
ncbi:MAG: hypothetical protein ACRDX8_07385 [Acidimicrobiales bacterium]